MLHPYKIWTNDGLIKREDAELMHHVDEQEAVEEFVEIYDRRGDYYFANAADKDKLIIFVEDVDGHITKWNLQVEGRPQYYATKIK